MVPVPIIDIDTTGGNCTIDGTCEFAGIDCHCKLIRVVLDANTLHDVDITIGRTYPHTYQGVGWSTRYQIHHRSQGIGTGCIQMDSFVLHTITDFIDTYGSTGYTPHYRAQAPTR